MERLQVIPAKIVHELLCLVGVGCSGRGLPWHVGHAGDAKPNWVTDCRQPWNANRTPATAFFGGSVMMTSLSYTTCKHIRSLTSRHCPLLCYSYWDERVRCIEKYWTEECQKIGEMERMCSAQTPQDAMQAGFEILILLH